ncbi:MAG: amino acid transporter [Euryarchaeota archaeon]|nr:amino acid transporter [Euryarchaeota archaeon]MBT6683586.1 amino acid transporter [Euryarchaeota archaeon]
MKEGRHDLSLESVWLEGFAISITLIFALGPQNVFVLRQGLMKNHVFISCLVCAFSDALLIAAGVLGVGAFISEIEEIQIWISIFACLFLTTYGVMRLNSALNPVGMEVNLEETKSVKTTIMAGLAFTYLNPHVYVDTLLLIGGASSRYVGDEQLFFGLGAASASFIFFFSLGYGAKLMSPILNNAKSWRIIDIIIAAIMFSIAGFIISPYLF